MVTMKDKLGLTD